MCSSRMLPDDIDINAVPMKKRLASPTYKHYLPIRCAHGGDGGGGVVDAAQ